MKNITIVLMVSIYCASCAAPEIPKISPRPISEYTYFETIAGVSIAIDPYFERNRVEEIFGIDLMSKGILPVFTVIQNSTDTIYLVEKNNFSLRPSENENSNLTSDDYATIPNSKTGFAIGSVAVGLAVPASFFITVPFMEYLADRNYRTVQTLINLELPDKTLAETETTSGFVYFHLPSPTNAAYRSFDVRAKIKNTTNVGCLDFDFSVLPQNGENK